MRHVLSFEMWTPAQLPAVFGREAEGAGGAGGGGRHVLRGSRNLATLYQRRHLRLGEAAPCVSTTPADVHAFFFWMTWYVQHRAVILMAHSFSVCLPHRKVSILSPSRYVLAARYACMRGPCPLRAHSAHAARKREEPWMRLLCPHPVWVRQ